VARVSTLLLGFSAFSVLISVIVVVVMIIATANSASPGTIPFPVAGDWHSTKGHHDLGVVLLIDERLETRAGNHYSAHGRDLVEVLGNYGNGPNQMIDRENGLADAHREQAVRVSYS
jgi:hypothetical protein